MEVTEIKNVLHEKTKKKLEATVQIYVCKPRSL